MGKGKKRKTIRVPWRSAHDLMWLGPVCKLHGLYLSRCEVCGGAEPLRAETIGEAIKMLPKGGSVWVGSGTPVGPSLSYPAFKAEQDAKFSPLQAVFDQALAQTRSGKGRERHNPAGDQAFLDQQIVRFGDWMGSNHFQVGQAVKKAIESTKLPKERARAELLGAIVYLGAAVLMLDRLPERDPVAPTPPEERK